MIDRADVRFLLQELHNRPSRELESRVLKFVPCAPNPDELYRAVAERAIELANAEGGTILVGFSPDLIGPDAVHDCAGTDIEALRWAVYNLTSPGIMVRAWGEPFGERTLLVVAVPKGFPPHVLKGGSTGGRTTRRITRRGGPALARPRLTRSKSSACGTRCRPGTSPQTCSGSITTGCSRRWGS